MIFWLTALAVWIAAGARVGRVLVRPATTVRVAIVVAVACVAAASTVAIPDVAVSIDRLAPGGVRDGERLSVLLVISMWVGFTTATTVVAAATWPITSRKNLRHSAMIIYALGTAVVLAVLTWSARFGWGAVTFGSVVIAVTGLRALDWTPLGRGIAIFVAGTALVAALSAWQLRHEILDDSVTARTQEFAWAWSIASLLISIGAIFILVEIWIRARVLLRRVRVLHRVLTERFPEVTQDDAEHTTTVLRASDQVAQIMDALFLQAGSGAFVDGGSTPIEGPERARSVARWVIDPLQSDPLDTRWISPPGGVSTRRWVGDIAVAYAKESGS